MYAIFDSRGRRIVLPRATVAEATDTMASVIVGKRAPPERKREAWEALRDRGGYRVAWVATLGMR